MDSHEFSQDNVSENDAAQDSMAGALSHASPAPVPTAGRVASARNPWRALGLDDEEIELCLEAGLTADEVPSDKLCRRRLFNELRRTGQRVPLWIQITGMWPEMVVSMSPGVRRVRIRALYKAALALIRRELLTAKNDPQERTVYWDPIAAVCTQLEISHSKLSSLLKELTGNNLKETIDCVRVEQVKKKIKVKLREFTTCAIPAKESSPQRHGDTENGEEEKGTVQPIAVWQALRKSRKQGAFSNNTWAVELGFCNYRRLYRSCMAVFNQTPQQIELEIIEDLLTEPENGAASTGERFPEFTLEQIEAEIGKIAPFKDEG